MASDAEAIADLLTESWQDAYAGILPDALLRGRLPARTRGLGADRGQPAAGAVIVAEEAGRLLGFCAAWLRAAECYVDNLHLRPGRRGGGLRSCAARRGSRDGGGAGRDQRRADDHRGQ